MNTTYWVVFLLALLLTVYTGAQAIPLLVLLYTPRLLKFWFIDTAQGQLWISASPDVRDKIEQLCELGFIPLGIKVEKVLWQKPVYEVSLTNPEKETFAAIMLRRNDQVQGDLLFRVLGVYLFTPLTGGGVVFTRGRSRMHEIDLPDTSVKNNLAGDLKGMLSSHSQRVEAFKKKGRTPLSVRDQEARIAATNLFYESNYMRQARRNLPRLLPAINFALAIVLLIAVVLTYILRLTAR